MKNSFPLTVLSLKNSAYKLRRKKPTKGPTKSLAVITPINLLMSISIYIHIGRHSQSMSLLSLLLCKLRGKQLDKVRHKVLKMSHDEPSEESEKCKRRTRYDVHNAT